MALKKRDIVIETKFKSSGEKEVAKGFDDINKKTKQAQTETSKYNKVLKTVGTTIVATFAVDRVLQFGRQIIDVTANFQKLGAVLTTALGSRSEAQQAFEQIRQFASETPFQVSEITDSFVRLANQGFVPTIEELKKLGDLSASTGKEFDQLAEAIIDAQVGEFERLKEFGIRAQKEGDNVRFTFKGVETQVKFTQDAIRDYIVGLGDAAGISGSMAAISETLGGKISNLQDNWEAFLFTIGQGLDPILGGAIDTLSNLIDTSDNWTTVQSRTTDELIRTSEEVPALLSEYDSLLNKTELNKDEQERLNTVISQLAKEVPEAVIEFDKYGTALGINKTAVEDFITANNALLRAKFDDEIKALTKDLEGLEASLSGVNMRSGAAKQIFLENGNILKANTNILGTTISEYDKAGNKVRELAKGTQEYDDVLMALRSLQEQVSQQTETLTFKKANLLLRLQELGVELTKEQLAFLELNKLIPDSSDNTEEEARTIQFLQEEIKKLNNQLLKETTTRKEAIPIQAKIKSLQEEINAILGKGIELAKEYGMSFDIAINGLRDPLEQFSKEFEGITEENRLFTESQADLELRSFFAKEQLKIDKMGETTEALIAEEELRFQEVLASDMLTKEELELLEFEHQERITEIKRQAEEQRFQNAVTLARQTTDIFSNLNQVQTNVRIAELNKQLEAGEITEKQFEKRKKEALTRQARADKALALFTIGVETAVATAKALAVPPPPNIVLAALAAAAGAARATAVASTPIPQFAEGVIGLEGAGTGTSDSIDAKLSRGESVMTADETKRHRGLLESIRAKSLNSYLATDYIPKRMPEYNKQALLNNLMVDAKLNDGKITKSIRNDQKQSVYNTERIINELRDLKGSRGDFWDG